MCSIGQTARMAILELVRTQPDWMGALGVALTRPPGVPERRNDDDPWETTEPADRPRRISDDLAWFRQALDDPPSAGLQPLEESATVAAWESADDELLGRLTRLERRGILVAAGFLLHDQDPALD
jgi:hypothetical protein